VWQTIKTLRLGDADKKTKPSVDRAMNALMAWSANKGRVAPHG